LLSAAAISLACFLQWKSGSRSKPKNNTLKLDAWLGIRILIPEPINRSDYALGGVEKSFGVYATDDRTKAKSPV
jgi:hypothetical protein